MLRIFQRIKEWKQYRNADSAKTKPTSFEVLEQRILLSGDGLLGIGAPDPLSDPLQGGIDVQAASVVVAATLPYTQDFSSGLPGDADGWEYYSDNEGRIGVVNGRLRLDDTTTNSLHSLNEAILHVDLTERMNVTLTLDHWSWIDEFHPLPDSFTGHENGDGIALSVDGINWVKVADLTVSLTNMSFDLDAALALAKTAAGSSDVSNVRIKFQQYDNQPAYLDGREFDNIQVMAIEPEMDVLGNGQEIVDGDTTPSVPDGTDFGDVGIGNPLIHTFTIRNTGVEALNLTGGPKVQIVGSSEFTVTSQPLSPVAPNGGTTAFQIEFAPSSEATKTATVVIYNDDPNENPYMFEIKGTGFIVQEPEITVLGNDQEIADGDTTPSLDDWTDFGSVPQGQPGPTQTYTVRNDGIVALTLGTVNLPGGFTLVEALDSTLAPGASDTFTVQLDTDVLGIKGGQISFTNDDSNENPFNFAITGEVTVPPPAPQSVPYIQDFGGGLPGALEGWEYYSDNEGLIQVVNGVLRMDDILDESLFSLNEAILHVDLTGKTDVTLTLDHLNMNDENDSLPESFTDHENGDGIALSVDGINWVKVADLGNALTFTNLAFSLDAALAQAQIDAGSSDVSDVRIKFQQYDNYTQPLDGREFDNIRVTVIEGGLVGYWKMDDNAANTVVVDSSGTGNNGTALRNTADMYTTGMIDGASSFNGTGDYIDLQDVSFPSGNSPRSVSFWINAAASTNNYYIFYYGQASPNNRFSIYRDGRDGKLKVSAYANDWDTGHVLSTDVWTHVAFTFDSSTIKLYVDGSLVASTAKTYDTILDKAYIGCHGNIVAFFEGMLDEFAIHNKALSEGEIEALYIEGVGNRAPVADAGPDQSVIDTDENGSELITLDASGSSDPEGDTISYVWTEGGNQIATGINPTVTLTVGAHAITLTVTDDQGSSGTDTVIITITEPGSQDSDSVGYWKMDDNAANTVVIDSSGNGNNGTTQRNTADMYTTGVIDGASSFNGTGDYVDLANISLPSGNSPRSVSFWINAAASTNNHYIFYYGQASPNNRFSIYRDGRDGKLKVSAYANDWDTGHVLSTDVWTHVAFTFDSSTIKLYVDGSLVASTAKTYDTILDKAYIGCHGNIVAFFEGMLDEFAIYNEALSEGEIQALYYEGVGNRAPVADAGPDQSVTDADENGSELVTLDASGSSDPDGAIVSYIWTEGGNQIATGVNPTVTLTVGAHAITLTVTDDQGSSGTDTVIITINELVSQAADSVGLWKMDDNAANSIVIDSSGNGNNGTAQRNTADMYTTGVIGGASSFNGTGDYIDLTDISLPSGNSPRSVSFWINAAASTNNYYIFYYGQASANNRFSIYRDGRDGKLKVSAYANDWDTGHVLSTGAWTHVAFTFDSSTIKLYVDGSFVVSTAKTYDTILDKAYIGCHGNLDAFFEGMLDEFAVYDKALSGSEVIALYNERSSDPIPVVPQSIPHTQNFGSGQPGAVEGWEYYSDNEGRIEVVNGRLRMDDTTADTTYSRNEAILHVDLTGKTNMMLTLDHWSLGDQNHPLPASFTSSQNGDGIALSVDGVNWVKVTDLTGSFTNQSFDLDPVLEQAKVDAGISDVSDVRIKFQQYDNDPALSDGREFDNIRVSEPPPVPQSIPHTQDFGSGQPGWVDGWEYYSDNEGRIGVAWNGRLRMDDTTRNTTPSLNEAILHVDLTGKTNVTLTLDHWSHADQNHVLPSNFTGHYKGDGIMLSVDGINWVKVTDLTNDFTNQSFDLDPVLAQAKIAAGSSDVSDVRIKFQQYDNDSVWADGRDFDNIQVF